MAVHTTVVDFRKAIDNINATSFLNEGERTEALAAARSLCHRLERPMDSMLRLGWVEPAYIACLKICMDVGLFKALSGNVGNEKATHKVDDLARQTNTDPQLLTRILRLLASMDTVREVCPATFAATELSNGLVERHINAAIDYRFIISGPAFQHLPAFLKHKGYQNPKSLLDSPWQFAAGTKLSFFDWIGQNPHALEMFTNHMAGYTSQRRTWQEIYPIEQRILGDKTELTSSKDLLLVDLGGGAGHDLKRFVSRYLPLLQEARLVLQDLPEVINEVQNTGTLPRSIRAVPIDFTKESPVAGARAYYMHSVLHDWPDDEVRNILKQIRGTLLQKTADGHTPLLLLNENVLPIQGTQPQAAALDIIMMAAFASHERSEQQWRDLLVSVGYKVKAIYWGSTVDEAIIEATVL